MVRDCPEPFGGLQVCPSQRISRMILIQDCITQLVLSGDFFQLPPVPDQSYEYRMAATYAFDAKSWSTCISQPIFLTQVFRQKDNGQQHCLFNPWGIQTPSSQPLLKSSPRHGQGSLNQGTSNSFKCCHDHCTIVMELNPAKCAPRSTYVSPVLTEPLQ